MTSRFWEQIVDAAVFRLIRFQLQIDARVQRSPTRLALRRAVIDYTLAEIISGENWEISG